MDTLICLSTEEVLCSPQLNSSAEQKCTNSALEELQNRTSPQCTGRVTWQAWRLPSAARVRMSSSGLHLILDSQQSTVNSIISGKYNYILLFWLWVFKSWLKRFCNIKRCFSLNHMFYIISINYNPMENKDGGDSFQYNDTLKHDTVWCMHMWML